MYFKLNASSLLRTRSEYYYLGGGRRGRIFILIMVQNT